MTPLTAVALAAAQAGSGDAILAQMDQAVDHSRGGAQTTITASE